MKQFSTSRKRIAAVIAGLTIASPIYSIPVLANGQLEEILVTARQKEESLQDVPVTVSAFSQETMENYNVQNLSDLSNLIPAVDMYQVGSGNGTALNIRGIGSSSLSAAFDSSVAISIDGVVGNTGRLISNAYLDMKQVEVLKGPQSLYFGKSATAGVVAITTNDPGDEFELILSGGYGFEQDATYSEFIISGPITDTLAARLSLGYQEVNELYENLSSNTTAPDVGEESLNSRLTVLWDPNERLSARFKLNYSEYENDGPSSVFSRRCVDGVSQAASGSIGGGIQPTIDPDCRLDGKASVGDANPILYTGVSGGNGGVRYLEQELLLTSLQLDFKLTDSLDLTSITGWLDQETNDLGNYCYCTVPTAIGNGNRAVNIYEGFTQEFRLASNFDGPFNFMAGLYYEDVYQDIESATSVPNIALAFGVDPRTGIGADWEIIHETDTRTVSAFLAGSWAITDTIELSGGARYTDAQRERDITVATMHVVLESFGFVPAGSQFNAIKFDDTNWSPEVALTWDATDELTFYAAYKTGFKSGGIDTSALPSGSFNPSNPDFPGFLLFDSEESDGFEIGMKSTLLDGSMRLNATAYSYVYDDLQTQFVDVQAGQYVTFNAGQLTAEGLEFDLQWATPMEGLMLRSNWAYTDTTYTDTFIQADGNDLNGLDREGIPEITGNIGFTYDWNLADDWTLSLNGDARYSGSYVTGYPGCNASCTPVSNVWHQGFAWKQDSFWLYDASLRLASEQWEFLLSGVNLADEYFVYRESDIPFAQRNLSGAPGTTGFTDSVQQTNTGRKVVFRVTYRL